MPQGFVYICTIIALENGMLNDAYEGATGNDDNQKKCHNDVELVKALVSCSLGQGAGFALTMRAAGCVLPGICILHLILLLHWMHSPGWK